MNKILTWFTPSSNGAFQKDVELGIYSDLLTVKPVFSFAYTNMNYIEQNGTFDIDGEAMTVEQKAEVLAVIEQINPSLDWYKNNKLQSFSAQYQTAIKALAGIVDSTEMASWTKQEGEARAYVADNLTVTPILSAMIVARNMGETVLDLATKIITKSDLYAVAFATILGTYQSKQQLVNSCITVADVLAVV